VSALKGSSTESSRVRYSTRQRAAIDEVMAHLEDFSTAQEVYEVLRGRGSKVGLTTVYRHLSDMADAGELDALRTQSGETVYRRCEAGSHHHHLVCRSCGRTLEFEGPEVEAWAERVAREARFVDVSHTVEIFGTCVDCAAKRAVKGAPASRPR
jgi:Fur family ferric uptake transcriptional regulator